eukprot:scaffold215658_cov51-Prasinocladus_malaysianus.AAC.1
MHRAARSSGEVAIHMNCMTALRIQQDVLSMCAFQNMIDFNRQPFCQCVMKETLAVQRRWQLRATGWKGRRAQRSDGCQRLLKCNLDRRPLQWRDLSCGWTGRRLAAGP